MNHGSFSPQRIAQVFLLSTALLTLTSTAAARTPYSLSIESPSPGSLKSYRHAGKRYILGNAGQRYNLRVRNNTASRVEVVLTVDGRDVISGRRGSFTGQRGYLIDAWDSMVVSGFRTSHQRVAAFRFTDRDNSYSARMGTPENVGIVGAAFFPEQRRHRRRWHQPSHRARQNAATPRELKRLDNSERPSVTKKKPSRTPTRRQRTRSPGPQSPAGGAGSYHEEENQHLGTEYGESRWSTVREVSFRRQHANSPREILTLYYDDAQGLRNRGIRLYPPRPMPRPPPALPQAFPANRFAPPPPIYGY